MICSPSPNILCYSQFRPVVHKNVAMQHRQQEDRDSGDASLAYELKTCWQRTEVNCWEYQQEHTREASNAINLRQISTIGKDNGLSMATANADRSHPDRKVLIAKRKATRKLGDKTKSEYKCQSRKRIEFKHSHKSVISASYNSAEAYSGSKPRRRSTEKIDLCKYSRQANKSAIGLEACTFVPADHKVDDDIASSIADDERRVIAITKFWVSLPTFHK